MTKIVQLVPGFNPTLVRFCRTVFHRTFVPMLMFQSHLGSILPHR